MIYQFQIHFGLENTLRQKVSVFAIPSIYTVMMLTNEKAHFKKRSVYTYLYAVRLYIEDYIHF